MEGFLTYFLTSIIAYLGLMGGFALAHISPEELKPGKKYFEAVKDFAFIIIMLLLFFVKIPLMGVISIIAVGVYLKFGKGATAMKIVYGVIGVVFAMLSKDRLIFPITASIVFIFGLAAGTLCVIKYMDKSRTCQLFHLLASNALFFVTALPLYFSNL